MHTEELSKQGFVLTPIWVLRMALGLALVVYLILSTEVMVDNLILHKAIAFIDNPAAWFDDALHRLLFFEAYVLYALIYGWIWLQCRTWFGRIGWLLAILIFGGLGILVFVVKRLWTLPPNAPLKQVLWQEPQAK